MQFFSGITSKIVFLSLLLAPVQQGLVACIGADGHQEIEISSMGNCFSCLGEDDHDLAPSETSTDVDHCGDCTDIPLTNDPAQVKSKPKQFYAPAILKSILVHCVFSTVCDASDPTARPNPPPVLTAIVSLKTIVLLI